MPTVIANMRGNVLAEAEAGSIRKAMRPCFVFRSEKVMDAASVTIRQDVAKYSAVSASRFMLKNPIQHPISMQSAK